jgi:hypothetical protein
VAPRVSAGIPPTIIPAAQPVVPAPAANPLLKQTKNPRRSKWSWSPGKF